MMPVKSEYHLIRSAVEWPGALSTRITDGLGHSVLVLSQSLMILWNLCSRHSRWIKRLIHSGSVSNECSLRFASMQYSCSCGVLPSPHPNSITSPVLVCSRANQSKCLWFSQSSTLLRNLILSIVSVYVCYKWGELFFVL